MYDRPMDRYSKRKYLIPLAHGALVRYSVSSEEIGLVSILTQYLGFVVR